MPRGVALSTLRTYLKAEIRDTQETNTAFDAELNYLLSTKQRDFANQFDWPFLRHDWDLSLTSSTRYYDIPTQDTRAQSVTINFARPVQVSLLWSGTYLDVFYGITTEEYNIREGANETQDPVQKWQIVTNVGEASNPNEIEVWPVPASSQTLRFTGQREVRTLASDSDTADLDDLLLVYSVAADYLLFRNQANAPLVQAKAQAHLARLLNSYPSKSVPPVKFGGYQPYSREIVKLVAVT